MIVLIWIISIIVLLASIVFVYKMLVTSNEFIATDKIFPFKFLKGGSGQNKSYRKSLSVLNSKIKSLEDSNAYYEMQFSNLQPQVKESPTNSLPQQKKFAACEEEEAEDWEELYYQENERKVQLENDLDQALQKLEAVNQETLLLKKEFHTTALLNSKLDVRLNELKSIQNEVETLQAKLNGAAERENELQTLLNKEIALVTVYDKIENDNVRLRSELENQKRHLTEMYQKEEEATKQLLRAKELHSHLGVLYEEEKNRKIVELNNKMGKNKIFSD